MSLNDETSTEAVTMTRVQVDRRYDVALARPAESSRNGHLFQTTSATVPPANWSELSRCETSLRSGKTYLIRVWLASKGGPARN